MYAITVSLMCSRCKPIFLEVMEELGRKQIDDTDIQLSWIFERFGLETTLMAVPALPKSQLWLES